METATKITTRFARLIDIDQILTLENQCFQTDRLSKRQLTHFIQIPSAKVFVSEKNNRVVAQAIILLRKNSAIARLYSLAVDPRQRQQGIGESMCEYIESHCKKYKLREIRLEVRKDNQRAIRFYQKLGYHSFAEYKNFYTDGEDALRMSKKLL